MALAAAVFVGDATAPLLALMVVLAPLLALMTARERVEGSGPGALVTVAGLSAVGLVLSANTMIIIDVARLWGIPLRQSLAVMAVSTGLILIWRRASGLWALALVLGTVGLMVVVVAMSMALQAPPWTVWAHLASRPTLAFSPEAAWVTEGRTVSRPTTLTFDEMHRVTALSTGVFRVSEGRRAEGAVREWRLSPGEELALHAGDRLTIPPDARVRFEAGKRIPGAPPSGVAWAEPPRRPSWRALIEALGLAVTLAGGAVTLMGGHARVTRLGAATAPLLLLAFALIAASWGVYAVWVAADLGLGASSLDPLVGAVQLSLRGYEPIHLLLLGVLGLVVLFIANAAGLEARVGTLWESWRGKTMSPAARLAPNVLWLGMLAVGVLLSQWELQAGTLLRLGLGFGASAWAAPRLGGARGGAPAGALTGAVVFSILSMASVLAPPSLAPLGPYPALVAAPAAAAVAAIGRRRSPHAQRVRRPAASVAGSGRP